MRTLFLATAGALLTSMLLPSNAVAAGVTTIAGSGAEGIQDGPALSATFMAPVGIAVDGSGAVYIADRAAQRIRVLRDGVVRTIAGSGTSPHVGEAVTGGFENGPLLRARFFNPSAIAIGPEGALYVADTMNRCIRIIRDGMVTTYAGQPGVFGLADGPKLHSSFKNPDSLAIDGFGNIYVGDYGVGVRKITPSGNVSTLQLPPSFKNDVTGIAVVGKQGEYVFAANRDGILRFEVASGKSSLYSAGAHGPREDVFGPHVFIDGYRSIGYPFSIAPLGTLDFAYTDIWTSSVRVIYGNFTTALAGGETENAAYTAGDFRDGASGQARFNTPMGIAIKPDGSFVVADAGNRRIRLIPPTSIEQAAGASDLARSTEAYRIALVGNSYVLYNASWEESIAGQVQSQLQKNWKALGIPRKPVVFAIKLLADTTAIGSYAQNYLASGIAEAVVWPFNSANVFSGSGKPVGLNLGDDPSWWLPQAKQALSRTAEALSRSGTYFLPTLLPMPYEVSTTESSWYRLYDLRTSSSVSAEAESYDPTHRALLKALQSTQRPVLDLWPLMIKEETKPLHPALYATRDSHLSMAGNTLVANAIVKRLEQDHPWRK